MNCQLVHLKKTAKQQQKTNYTEFSPYAKTIDNGDHNKNNNDNNIDNNNNYNCNNNNTNDRKLIEKKQRKTSICGKYFCDTPVSHAPFVLFSLLFDVICDILLNRAQL